MKRFAIFILAALLATACDPLPSGESTGAKREAKATQQLLDQATTAVGMPAIQNFTEKRNLKMLYELRDNADLVTYTYYVDWNGNRHKVCPTTSIGYGIPFSAQFTAPQRPDYMSYQDNAVVHQPEPNGLYMPDATAATWVMCMNPETNEPSPVYVEPGVMVSTFPLD